MLFGLCGLVGYIICGGACMLRVVSGCSGVSYYGGMFVWVCDLGLHAATLWWGLWFLLLLVV